MYLYDRPPDPDHVAPRGTDKYRDAVDDYQKWVAFHVNRNYPLDVLIDKYDDYGNLSHDWKQWNDMMPEGSVSDVPKWLGMDLWNIGAFHKATQDGGATEWPPGSGRFFNDPANTQAHRQWFNEFGDRIPPPPDGGPDIDYNTFKLNETPAQWLARSKKEQEDAAKAKAEADRLKAEADAEEARHRANEAKAKPVIGGPGGPAPAVTDPNIPKPAPTAPQPGQIQPAGAWGVKSFTPASTPQPALMPGSQPQQSAFAAQRPGAIPGMSPSQAQAIRPNRRTNADNRWYFNWRR